MKTSLLLLAGVLFLLGCAPIPDVPNHLNRERLYDRFHGKYEVVSSTSNEPADVNFDGRATTDMMQEISQLNKAYGNNLEIHIYGKSRHVETENLLFLQWWPEQYIWLPTKKADWAWEPLAYNPNLTVNYAMQGTTRTFSITPDLKTITVADDEFSDKSVRWKKPLAVNVVGQHTIEVVNRKTLYTREGTKEVIITTRYERFTMAT